MPEQITGIYSYKTEHSYTEAIFTKDSFYYSIGEHLTKGIWKIKGRTLNLKSNAEYKFAYISVEEDTDTISYIEVADDDIPFPSVRIELDNGKILITDVDGKVYPEGNIKSFRIIYETGSWNYLIKNNSSNSYRVTFHDLFKDDLHNYYELEKKWKITQNNKIKIGSVTLTKIP